MFDADRDQVRQMFIRTWDKARAGEPLQDLEKIIAGVIEEHPEYQGLLESGDRGIGQEWTPEHGQENPFLHMGMHITIREQIAVDRPPGIREAHAELCRTLGNPMRAEHEIMEILGEILWNAQRQGLPPDETAYLSRVRRLAGLTP
ncbi:hypothetical protein J2T60_000113 [Natronospira proteinivora]|uniref:DUF1841 family protein n=1 Tax=Natronospira proteinivora TaxID=1807133 RepID=A0ABT1G4D1_9GAMM|nr:DUF1841 family protein [Natronospira proteinivora]MCP1726148.1 hypothetical protein [Natronospira proteinivora]